MSPLLLLSVLGLAQSAFQVTQLGQGDRHGEGCRVAMSKDGSKLVYGVYGGSTYTSSDSGATWDLTSVPRVTGSWTGVALSPDGTKIALAEKGGNLWGSGDFGANWDQADPAFALQWSDIDVTDHDTVIAVTSDSIIASSIAGAMGPYLQTNFSHLPLLMNTVVASPDLSYTVALAEWGVGNNGLYISTDGGQTFTQSNSSEAPDAQGLYDFAMSADATIQAIVADQGNYLSADRGATWKQVPGQYSCASAAMSEDGSKIFLCCRPLSGTGVVALLSGDGGMTWGTDYWLDVVTDVLDCDSAAMSGDGTMAAFAGWGQNPYVVTFTPTYSTTTTTGTSTVTTVTATTVTTTTVSTVTATDTSTATATAASDATGNTTTTMAPVPSVLEVSFQLTVDDPTTITENETVKNAMVQGVASSLGVDPSLVTLEFQEVPSRRLARSLQASTLLAIFKVTLPSKQAAESAKASFDQLSLTEATADITSFLADAGYAGTVEVTGKTATVATTTTTTSTTTTSTTASTTTRLDAANVATSRVVSVALLAASLASIF